MPATLTEPQSRSSTPHSGWDSELFVLRGDDRADLQNRVKSLCDFVERQPNLALGELAFSLSTQLQPGGSRLAIVASSSADLLTKLHRANQRLADQKAKQIRDSNGIYYFSQPLSEQGTVALLFPGEAAQYLNMLADLCGVFPEVEDTFAWCDQVAIESGKPESSLRRLLHLPPSASLEAIAAAESELRKLGSSIFGVLIADLAITRVLWNLQIPISAVAGHSAGELAALLASGAMKSQSVLGPRLAEIMEMMQRQEDEAGGLEVALLAVGAGKQAVVEVTEAVARGSVIIAMDNCPHQCVAVGPTQHVATVEVALTEKGVICERLPFRRPYHTPLFEPWMGPFRELFEPVPFDVPQTPVYCCSTGQKFPDNPDAIRQLAVNHWVNPVEFSRMIETMFADGVRVFVEAGPRGNLSAFVEDILRGKSFAAIPANVPRKSGPTQINHMVAQLVAHHVPLNLGHLYAQRPTPNPALQGGEKKGHALFERTGDFDSSGFSSPLPAGRGVGGVGHAHILNSYLDAMEQFLDVQREVMEAFLSGRQTPREFPAELLSFPELAPADSSLLIPHSSLPSPHPSLPTQSGYCLVGRVERFDPGREIVFRRELDEREDLYVDDHTLGGRGVSRVNPAQNGLPVLPMTFSLEAMSEAASLLAPDKVVIAIQNIRMLRWVPFDPEPTTFEVRASVASIDPTTGVVEVKADVRDLGNSFLPDGVNKPACEATIVLADSYPDPPPLRPFHLTDEYPCHSTVEDLRRNMFHGPLFQMIHRLGRTGREGIEGALFVQPRNRWFRSNPDPRVVIDPVLVDAAMHILGAWHLEQPDWSGRILLPIGIHRMEFFGLIPAIGTEMLVRGHNEEETARQVRHGLEVFTPDSRLWLRLTGANYWRFYLPFGDVNFFGPKDQYFLSTRVNDAEPRDATVPARCYFLDPPLDLQQPVMRASGVRVTMTLREIAEFTAWSGTDSERSDWFFTRLLAKDAVRAAWNQRHSGGVFPADIETEVIEGHIVCKPRGEAGPEPFPPVTVVSAEGKVAAFSAFASRVGIGLQKLPRNAAAEVEKGARARAACLAAADALRVPVERCTVSERDEKTGELIVSVGRERIRVQTARHKDTVVATTMGEGV